MSKNKQNTANILLTTAENLSDEILFKTANSFLEDVIKSVPFASLITNSIDTYTQFKIVKEQKQLLAFIQETEASSPAFVEKFFKDKSNIELGLEILGILDQTYLEHQARMIGRTAVLLKNKDISKEKFDRYTYIITKLNNHIILKIEELNSLSLAGKNSVPFQLTEFLSFEFVERNLEPTFGDQDLLDDFKNHEYKILDNFHDFYKNIFKD